MASSVIFVHKPLSFFWYQIQQLRTCLLHLLHMTQIIKYSIFFNLYFSHQKISRNLEELHSEMKGTEGIRGWDTEQNPQTWGVLKETNIHEQRKNISTGNKVKSYTLYKSFKYQSSNLWSNPQRPWYYEQEMRKQSQRMLKKNLREWNSCNTTIYIREPNVKPHKMMKEEKTNRTPTQKPKAKGIDVKL